MLRNRKGKIEISLTFYDDNLELLSKLFEHLQFVPVNLHCNYMTRIMEIWGYSPKFDEIEEITKVPLYNVIVNEDKFEIEKR